jgi:creatinine amidohydrolase
MPQFAELNREQLRILAPEALALLPIGATEQHGPHLATGMDFLTVESIALEAARLAGPGVPVVVTPTLPFGSSHHHFVFGATMSFSTETYYRVLYELCESLVTDGFKRIFILNGHGGNHELAELAARDIVLKHPVRAAAGSYWRIAGEALRPVAPDRFPGHAGEFETSMMLALRPHLVAVERPARETAPTQAALPYRVESHGWWKDTDGFTDSPANADASRGRRYFDIVAASVAEALAAFYKA